MQLSLLKEPQIALEQCDLGYQEFCNSPPYTRLPFSKKTWGHRLHSLCSYQGKLKPAQAHWLVKAFSKPGDIVLDPLGGVGTIAFEACLQGRIGITSDLSPLASTIARAKVRPPLLTEAIDRLPGFWNQIEAVKLTDADWRAAEFGLNSSVADYYHEETLAEVLRARRWFLDNGSRDDMDTFFKACCLHVLHGNRPYAISRTSHPITPFSPTGPFEYRSLKEKIQERFFRALTTPLEAPFTKGTSYHSDFRDLPAQLEKDVDLLITSPPFVGMRFDRPNWLRMWFCGWGPADFSETSLRFLERQQTKSPQVYAEFFRICHTLMKPDGLAVIHVGKSKKYDMISNLLECSSKYFDKEWVGEEDVQHIDKHGIGDKGQTTANYLLFLKRKK